MHFLRYLIIFSGLLSQNIYVPYPVDRNDYPVESFQNYLSFTKITDVVESHNTIYFSTLGAGILRYDKFSNTFLSPYTTAQGLHSNFIYKLMKSNEDTLLSYASTIGIYHRNSLQVMSTDQPDNFRLHLSSGSFFKGHQEINSEILSFNIDDDAIYTFKQPYHFIDKRVQDEHLNSYDIRLRYLDKSGGIWLFVDQLGLFYARSRSDFFERMKVPVHFGMVTRVGIFNNEYWFTQRTDDKQKHPVLTKWKESGEWINWYAKNEFALQGNSVHDIAFDKENIWLAESFGLVSYNQRRNEFYSHRFSGAYNIEVNAIKSVDSLVFLGTKEGLYEFRKQSGLMKKIEIPHFKNDEVFSVAVGNSIVMSLTRNSIMSYDLKSNQITNILNQYKLPNIRYSHIYFSDNKFFIGSSRGVYIIDTKDKSLNTLSFTSGKDHVFINSIKYTDGYMFLATNRGLYIYYLEKKEWLLFNSRSGFPMDHINDINIDGDFLIVGTNAGVSVFKWYDEFYWK